VLPNCGHMSNLEQPERFNQAVREFCRAHSGRTAPAPSAEGDRSAGSQWEDLGQPG
jgi:hypothetical protein